MILNKSTEGGGGREVEGGNEQHKNEAEDNSKKDNKLLKKEAKLKNNKQNTAKKSGHCEGCFEQLSTCSSFWRKNVGEDLEREYNDQPANYQTSNGSGNKEKYILRESQSSDKVRKNIGEDAVKSGSCGYFRCVKDNQPASKDTADETKMSAIKKIFMPKKKNGSSKTSPKENNNVKDIKLDNEIHVISRKPIRENLIIPTRLSARKTDSKLRKSDNSYLKNSITLRLTKLNPIDSSKVKNENSAHRQDSKFGTYKSKILTNNAHKIQPIKRKFDETDVTHDSKCGMYKSTNWKNKAYTIKRKFDENIEQKSSKPTKKYKKTVDRIVPEETVSCSNLSLNTPRKDTSLEREMTKYDENEPKKGQNYEYDDLWVLGRLPSLKSKLSSKSNDTSQLLLISFKPIQSKESHIRAWINDVEKSCQILKALESQPHKLPKPFKHYLPVSNESNISELGKKSVCVQTKNSINNIRLRRSMKISSEPKNGANVKRAILKSVRYSREKVTSNSNDAANSARGLFTKISRTTKLKYKLKGSCDSDSRLIQQNLVMSSRRKTETNLYPIPGEDKSTDQRSNNNGGHSSNKVPFVLLTDVFSPRHIDNEERIDRTIVEGSNQTISKSVSNSKHHESLRKYKIPKIKLGFNSPFNGSESAYNMSSSFGIKTQCSKTGVENAILNRRMKHSEKNVEQKHENKSERVLKSNVLLSEEIKKKIPKKRGRPPKHPKKIIKYEECSRILRSHKNSAKNISTEHPSENKVKNKRNTTISQETKELLTDYGNKMENEKQNNDNKQKTFSKTLVQRSCEIPSLKISINLSALDTNWIRDHIIPLQKSYDKENMINIELEDSKNQIQTIPEHQKLQNNKSSLNSSISMNVLSSNTSEKPTATLHPSLLPTLLNPLHNSLTATPSSHPPSHSHIPLKPSYIYQEPASATYSLFRSPTPLNPPDTDRKPTPTIHSSPQSQRTLNLPDNGLTPTPPPHSTSQSPTLLNLSETDQGHTSTTYSSSHSQLTLNPPDTVLTSTPPFHSNSHSPTLLHLPDTDQEHNSATHSQLTLNLPDTVLTPTPPSHSPFHSPTLLHLPDADQEPTLATHSPSHPSTVLSQSNSELELTPKCSSKNNTAVTFVGIKDGNKKCNDDLITGEETSYPFSPNNEDEAALTRDQEIFCSEVISNSCMDSHSLIVQDNLTTLSYSNEDSNDCIFICSISEIDTTDYLKSTSTSILQDMAHSSSDNHKRPFNNCVSVIKSIKDVCVTNESSNELIGRTDNSVTTLRSQILEQEVQPRRFQVPRQNSLDRTNINFNWYIKPYSKNHEGDSFLEQKVQNSYLPLPGKHQHFKDDSRFGRSLAESLSENDDELQVVYCNISNPYGIFRQTFRQPWVSSISNASLINKNYTNQLVYRGPKAVAATSQVIDLTEDNDVTDLTSMPLLNTFSNMSSMEMLFKQINHKARLSKFPFTTIALIKQRQLNAERYCTCQIMRKCGEKEQSTSSTKTHEKFDQISIVKKISALESQEINMCNKDNNWEKEQLNPSIKRDIERQNTVATADQYELELIVNALNNLQLDGGNDGIEDKKKEDTTTESNCKSNEENDGKSASELMSFFDEDSVLYEPSVV